ncbi:MAG: type II secretion system F family protein [Acidobacteria bacterium]|nr:type II secretion system F family protein [Acidobacteriota bacterium]
MAEFLLKYADGKGEIRQQVAEAGSEKELRERMTQQGFLVYSVKARGGLTARLGGGSKKINLEKFLIFNQQFLTLVRAGLPILKSLDLLADRLTDPKLGKHVKAVRDEVRNGTMLSEAFSRQRVFPAIYVTSILAGEKSGSLGEVIERYVSYQRLNLTVRKKIVVSLLYPAILIVLVMALIVFMITYVVPNFAQLYSSLESELPYMTQVLIAVGTGARDYILAIIGAVFGAIVAFRLWAQTDRGKEQIESIQRRLPIVGEIWTKYQVAQLGRVLSTLLVGGIPLVQALETAGESLGARTLKRALSLARQSVKEGQPLSGALQKTGVFPGLAIDMIEVGESTGALPAMLNSVAEFYEEDVNTRMTASLALIEPAIMLFMGVFVAFVLVALYLPIFSLADTLGR